MWLFWEKYGLFAVFGAGIGLIVLGIALGIARQTASKKVEFLTKPADPVKNQEIIVDIGGAVAKPGIYRLKANSRLVDLLAEAGDLTSEVDTDWVQKTLNMARTLTDGEKIYILKIGDAKKTDVLGGNTTSLGGQSLSVVNLNTALASELDTLPGIGPSFAQRIIEYRKANGGFKSIEEIQAVSGIGKKLFEQIKDKISI